MKSNTLSDLEKGLHYQFKNRTLLKESLRHKSFINEQPFKNLADNERLEFLGDAVLNIVISHLLMVRHPDMNEGGLSIKRASLVNDKRLAELARVINLGKYLSLGKGEIQTRGWEKKSILADAYEAIIAAVYLDGGFATVYHFIDRHFLKLMQSEDFVVPTDFKSQVQELLQKQHQPKPIYKVIAESGPDHDKTFIVEIEVENIKAQGQGKNKKEAEQDAADHFLQSVLNL